MVQVCIRCGVDSYNLCLFPDGRGRGVGTDVRADIGTDRPAERAAAGAGLEWFGIRFELTET